MSITVTFPKSPSTKKRAPAFGIELEFSQQGSSDGAIEKAALAVPVFSVDNQDFVLIRDLAKYWGYPSSYQLIVKLVKCANIEKSQILKTDKDLNKELFELDLIEEADTKIDLFYISLPLVYSRIENKQVFYVLREPDQLKVSKAPTQEKPASVVAAEEDDDNLDDDEEDEVDEDMDEDNDNSGELSKGYKHMHKDHLKYINDDRVTIGQVFHQYGLDPSTPLTHSLFNSINSMSKLNYYKNFGVSGYRFLPNSKLSYAERELVLNANNYNDMHINEKTESKPKKSFRKPIGKSKKHNLQIDPNSIDLSESVIPGQGFIPDFSIHHLCKVPNYYVTSNHQSLPLSFNTKNLNATSNSSYLFNDNVKIKSKSIQKLVFNSDTDNYHHTKYFYTKTYRGPGSGNYKDGALMNKINKIHLSSNKKPRHKRKVSNNNRYNKSLKGLVHEKFDKNFVEYLLSEQRKYTEDYSNLEILHNSLQFNVLLNTYRGVAQETWNNYYKFKLIDFEQLKALQMEANELEERKLDAARHQQWAEEEKLRQERLRLVFEDERNEFEQLQSEFGQRKKDLEEKLRRRQLEASLSDSFEADSENDDESELAQIQQDFESSANALKTKFEAKRKDLINPAPPPQPIETPQLDLNNKFSLPTVYPEIIRNLPLELRGVVQESKEELPPIKKPIRYVTTYPERPNPEYLTRIEIIKLPNANSVGWDNFKKYKDSDV